MPIYTVVFGDYRFSSHTSYTRYHIVVVGYALPGVRVHQVETGGYTVHSDARLPGLTTDIEDNGNRLNCDFSGGTHIRSVGNPKVWQRVAPGCLHVVKTATQPHFCHQL